MNRLIYVFYLFCFFPYLRILPLNLDCQPNALILGGLLSFFLIKSKIPKDLGRLFLVLLIAFLLVPLTSPDSNGLRSFANYLSLTVISSSTYLCLMYSNGLSYIFFKKVIWGWFIIGGIQLLVYPEFLDFLLFRGSSEFLLSTGRGVSSMAVEPTHYGMMCIMFLIVNYLNFKNEKEYRRIFWLLVIQLVFFSQSSTCAIIVFVSYGLYLLFGIKNCIKKISYIFIFTISMLGFVFILLSYYPDTRLSMILNFALNNPYDVIIFDESINFRFINLFFPFIAFFENWGFPYGYNHFREFVLNTPSDYYDLVRAFEGYGMERIISGLGAIVFELGFFSIIIIGIIYNNFAFLMKKDSKIQLLFLLFMGVLLNAINFNNAFVDFLIGNIIFLSFKEKNKCLYNGDRY